MMMMTTTTTIDATKIQKLRSMLEQHDVQIVMLLPLLRKPLYIGSDLVRLFKPEKRIKKC
jgi:hypothetical protein